jgi:hypothetical protein
MTEPIQIKVRPQFNVFIPSKDPKESGRYINENETAYVSEEEYNGIAHQVDVIEPIAKAISSSPSQPATDLREAYRVCEPKPLDGDDFEKYYEPLLDEDDFDAVKAIGASLFVQELGEHKTFFLAGHRGCGKTTQLNLLIKNWCSDYHVIYIEADKISNTDKLIGI